MTAHVCARAVSSLITHYLFLFNFISTWLQYWDPANSSDICLVWHVISCSIRQKRLKETLYNVARYYAAIFRSKFYYSSAINLFRYISISRAHPKQAGDLRNLFGFLKYLFHSMCHVNNSTSIWSTVALQQPYRRRIRIWNVRWKDLIMMCAAPAEYHVVTLRRSWMKYVYIGQPLVRSRFLSFGAVVCWM